MNRGRRAALGASRELILETRCGVLAGHASAPIG